MTVMPNALLFVGTAVATFVVLLVSCSLLTTKILEDSLKVELICLIYYLVAGYEKINAKVLVLRILKVEN